MMVSLIEIAKPFGRSGKRNWFFCLSLWLTFRRNVIEVLFHNDGNILSQQLTLITVMWDLFTDGIYFLHSYLLPSFLHEYNWLFPRTSGVLINSFFGHFCGHLVSGELSNSPASSATNPQQITKRRHVRGSCHATLSLQENIWSSGHKEMSLSLIGIFQKIMLLTIFSDLLRQTISIILKINKGTRGCLCH